MSRLADSPALTATAGNPQVLTGDHGGEKEPPSDVAIDVGEAPKDAAVPNTQAVAADARQPVSAAQRPPFMKDPFGWVLRPRMVQSTALLHARNPLQPLQCHDHQAKQFQQG